MSCESQNIKQDESKWRLWIHVFLEENDNVANGSCYFVVGRQSFCKPFEKRRKKQIWGEGEHEGLQLEGQKR